MVREDRNWEKTELAQKASISRPTLDSLEAGNECNLTTFLKVFKVLDMPFEELESYHLKKQQTILQYSSQNNPR